MKDGNLRVDCSEFGRVTRQLEVAGVVTVRLGHLVIKLTMAIN